MPFGFPLAEVGAAFALASLKFQSVKFPCEKSVKDYNIVRALMLPSTVALVSLDQLKAFDRVSWDIRTFLLELHLYTVDPNFVYRYLESCECLTYNES